MYDRNRFFTIHRVCARVFRCLIVARCARSMLSERYVPEVWGYLELPDGTSRAIEHWECILGRAKVSDIVLTGEGIERSHAAIQRSGAGEWTLSALDGGRGVWLNGKAVTGDAAPRRRYAQAWRNGAALSRAGRRAARHIAAQAPLTGHKVQPAVTLLLLVCFQLVLLFQFFLHDARRGARLHRALVRAAHCDGVVLLFCDAQHFRARI